MPTLALVTAGIYALMSGITFVVYALDKRAAVRDQRRTPERTLHTLELLGGWPGALLAQRVIRHKNRKGSYQLVFWAIVALHALGWALAAWLAWR